MDADKDDTAPPDVQVVDEVGFEDHDALRKIEIPKNKWVRRYRSVFFQIVILSILSFSGPSMSNAISTLGGGGLATPYTANTASAVQYAVSVVFALLGGPIISGLGVPIACIIGAIGFPLSGSGFYVNSKYGNQWYLIFAKAMYGATSAFLYIAEAAAMISYPEEHRRGLYISIWVGMRSLGSVIAGAMTFGLNIANSGSGGVSTSTYLVFLGIECIGFPASLLLSRASKVVRADGYGVPLLPKKNLKTELKLLLKHHLERRTWMLIPIYVFSFFGDGAWGTYKTLHFSVRSRALSALLGPASAIILNPLFGRLLDMRSVGPRRKANLAFWVWSLTTAAMFIWVFVINAWFQKQSSKLRIDYSDGGMFCAAWLPYWIYAVTCWMNQTLIYWVLGQFASDVVTNARTGGVFRSWETVGLAVTYALNTKSKTQWMPFGVYLGLFALSAPLFWWVIQELPVETKVHRIADADGLVHEEAVAETLPRV